ncbi:hypothetical protein D3C81_920560 [compost metagenome]
MLRSALQATAQLGTDLATGSLGAVQQRLEAVGQTLQTCFQHGFGIRHLDLGNLLPSHTLDHLQHAALARGHQQQRATGTTGTAGTTDAVHVGLRVVRHVDVEHVGDARYVEAAGGDVGGDHDVQGAVLERLDHTLALSLGDVAVQRGGAIAVALEHLGDVEGGLLGAHEADQRIELLDFQQTQHGSLLLVGVDHQVGLLDALDGLGLGGDLDVLRRLQVALGDGADRSRQGRGEQYGLAAFRQGLEDRLDVFHEAELEHLVGLVEDQTLNGGQQLLVATQAIAQATRGRHHHLGALAQSLELRPHGRAAVDRQHLHARHVAGVALEGRGDLQGQLAGRGQDEDLRLATGRVEQRQQRQGEGRGFAGTGLRLADHVVTGKDHRDRLGLNGGRLFVAHRGDRGKHSRVEIERGEAANDSFGHGCLPHVHPQRPMASAAQPKARPEGSPWQPGRRGFAKSREKDSSSRGVRGDGRTAEAALPDGAEFEQGASKPARIITQNMCRVALFLPRTSGKTRRRALSLPGAAHRYGDPSHNPAAAPVRRHAGADARYPAPAHRRPAHTG